MPTNNEGPSAASAVRHEVEGPKITDALYQPFRNEPTPVGIDPADGLPRPVGAQSLKDAQAPELDRDRFVCMADCSAFVLRDSWGNVIVRLEPSEVERTPSGVWRVKIETLLPKVTDAIVAAKARWLQRAASSRSHDGGSRKPPRERSDADICRGLFGGDDGPDGSYCMVEPLRPQCSHYARQLVPFPEEHERSLAIRLCTARRTDEGEFLDLGNQQILACELREPVYGNEAAQLDAFDERTIAAQQAAKAAEVADDFDVDAALAPTTKGPDSDG